MEKRVLLAAVLSGIVVIVWFSFFAPPRPNVPAPEPSPTKTTTGGGVPAPATPEEHPDRPAVPAISGDDVKPVALQGDGWQASVDPRGGALASLVVAGYRDEAGAPLELVRPGTLLPLSVGAPGAWNEALYRIERGPDWVALRWSDGGGNWVEKRIAAGKGKYSMDIEVRAGVCPREREWWSARGSKRG